jgi:hypothetical protein
MAPHTPTWHFDQIDADDPRRASALEAAPSPVALAEAVTRTFSTALTSGNVRIGLEVAGSKTGPDLGNVSIQ